MTARSTPDPPTSLWPTVDAEAPAERLAMFRILTGSFAVCYLLVRAPVFLQLGERDVGFDGVGVAVLLGGPVPAGVVTALVVATVLAGAGFTAGWRFVLTGPAFALGMLCLTSYRGSWGQLLHFENLVVLHLLIVAVSPGADVWSLDGRGGRRAARRSSPTAYGWPLALAALVVVVSYVIAGVAKLRYGGLEWIFGDTLRNHVAYSAVRLDLLGADPSPVAGWAVRHEWVWPFAAAGAVLVELSAPVALFGGRLRTSWVVAAWLMHAGIFVFMLVGFPYPLFLVAFAPFFRIERLWTRAPFAVLERLST